MPPSAFGRKHGDKHPHSPPLVGSHHTHFADGLRLKEANIVKEVRRKLTLHQPATYQIKVPGQLDESWTEWDGRMTVAVEADDDGQPVTILTGELDQAALQGMLRRLYALGLPLISVNCLTSRREDESPAG